VIGHFYTRVTVRRLFTSFAHGAPGAGLLLMRVAAGIGLVVNAVAALGAGPAIAFVVVDALAAGTGFLLVAGLWTPIAGALAAVIETWNAFVDPAHVRSHILLAIIGAALALLGPGAWSIDARLFGWKRVEIRDQKRHDQKRHDQKRHDQSPF
jgi:uncharacterized membrane protein YphA (DoxX/SURF4 family)